MEGGQFTKELLADQDLTTGRFDTRFTGPDTVPLSKEADYDPQFASISSAYVSAFNDHVRDLHFGTDETYKPEIDLQNWDSTHQLPGSARTSTGTPNVMPDLVSALNAIPLKMMLNGGYSIWPRPFTRDGMKMHHLQVPANLQDNIEYHYYQSGHMVYANEASLKQLHDNVAAFIERAGHSGT